MKLSENSRASAANITSGNVHRLLAMWEKNPPMSRNSRARQKFPLLSEVLSLSAERYCIDTYPRFPLYRMAPHLSDGEPLVYSTVTYESFCSRPIFGALREGPLRTLRLVVTRQRAGQSLAAVAQQQSTPISSSNVRNALFTSYHRSRIDF